MERLLLYFEYYLRERLDDIIVMFIDKLNFSDIICYFLDSAITLLPISPFQVVLDLVLLDDFFIYDDIISFMNWFIPFDIFSAMLLLWIPLMSSLYAFRISWKTIARKLNLI